MTLKNSILDIEANRSIAVDRIHLASNIQGVSTMRTARAFIVSCAICILPVYAQGNIPGTDTRRYSAPTDTQGAGSRGKILSDGRYHRLDQRTKFLITTTKLLAPGANKGLRETLNSGPQKNSRQVPGNFALKQLVGKKELPPTRLEGFVKLGGEAVFGDEGVFLPQQKCFEEKNRIERAMEYNPDLTTGHNIQAPSAWDFPQ
jgi:hypothetical protein